MSRFWQQQFITIIVYVEKNCLITKTIIVIIQAL